MLSILHRMHFADENVLMKSNIVASKRLVTSKAKPPSDRMAVLALDGRIGRGAGVHDVLQNEYFPFIIKIYHTCAG